MLGLREAFFGPLLSEAPAQESLGFVTRCLSQPQRYVGRLHDVAYERDQLSRQSIEIDLIPK